MKLTRKSIKTVEISNAQTVQRMRVGVVMNFFKSRDGMVKQSLSDAAWNTLITLGWIVGLPVLCWVAASIGYNL